MENFSSAYFSRAIERMLEGRGWTQRDLALKSGISQPSISRYLKQETEPKIGDIMAIASALSVNLDYLLNPDVYEEPMRLAKLAAAECTGSDQEKQIIFNDTLRQETAKLQARQSGWDDAMKIQDQAAKYGGKKDGGWRVRALTAEQQLSDLKALLKTTAEAINIPKS